MRAPSKGRRFFGLPALVLALLAVSPSHSERLTPHSDELEFEVVRDGVPVGQHRVTFTRDGEELRVEANFRLEIKLFALTLYSLDYASQTRWLNGKLLTLKARTNDDGTIATVLAERKGDAFRLTGPNGTQTVRGDLIPTDHWNIAVTESDRVLNTITGKVNAVRMRDLGSENVIAEGRTIEARRWAYTGDLENEVWYDKDGQWVKMRFRGRDGSTIEYVCRRCLSRKQRAADR